MKLNRFTGVEKTNRRYKVEDGFSVERHLGNAWRMIRGSKSYNVELWFDAEFAETLSETHWHDTQAIEWHDDESITFTCTVDGLDEIVWWVLSMGPHCVVKKPKALATRVQQLAQGVVDAYSLSCAHYAAVLGVDTLGAPHQKNYVVAAENLLSVDKDERFLGPSGVRGRYFIPGQYLTGQHVAFVAKSAARLAEENSDWSYAKSLYRLAADWGSIDARSSIEDLGRAEDAAGKSRSNEKRIPQSTRRWGEGRIALAWGLMAVVVVTGAFSYHYRSDLATFLGVGGGVDDDQTGHVVAHAEMVSRTEADLRQVEDRLGALEPVLNQLLTDRKDLKAQLIEAGVESSEDLAENPRGKVIARELAEVVAYSDRLSEKKVAYEEAQFQLEAMVRRLGRQEAARKAGLSDDELSEISVTLRSINARIADAEEEGGDLSEVQIDALVDRELTESPGD